MLGAPTWVGARLVRLARPVVSARPRPALADPVVRAALLVDLALRGHLDVGDVGDGSIELDTDHTGFPPADVLLDAVVAEPDRPVLWWLTAARVGGMDAVAAQLVADGVWARHGRADPTDMDPPSAAADAARVRAVVDGARADPATTAVAALLNILPAAGPAGGEIARQLAPGCGDAAWLAVELVDHLADRRHRLDAVSRDARWTDVVANFLP